MLKTAGVASKLVKNLGTETTSDTPKLVRALKKFAEEAKTTPKDLEALKKAAKDTIPASLQPIDQQRSDLVKSVLDAATPALERFMLRTRARKASIGALLADPTQVPPAEAPFSLENPLRLEFRGKQYESTVPASVPNIGMKDSEQTFADVPFTFSNPMFTQVAKDITLKKLPYVPPQIVADTLQAIGIQGKPPATPEEKKRLARLTEDQVTEEALATYELTPAQRVELQTALEQLKRGGLQAPPPVLADAALQARFSILQQSLLDRQRAWQKKEEDPPIDLTSNPMYARVVDQVVAKQGRAPLTPLTPTEKLALYSVYKYGTYPKAETIEKMADAVLQTAQEYEAVVEAAPEEKRPQVTKALTSVLKGDALPPEDPAFSIANPYYTLQQARGKAVRTADPLPRLDLATLDFSAMNPMRAEQPGGAAAATPVGPGLLQSMVKGFGPRAGKVAEEAAKKREEEAKAAAASVAVAGAKEGNTVSPLLTGAAPPPPSTSKTPAPGLLATFGPKRGQIAAAAQAKEAAEARKAAVTEAAVPAPPPPLGGSGYGLRHLLRLTRKNNAKPKSTENIEEDFEKAAQAGLSKSLTTPSAIVAAQQARAAGKAPAASKPPARAAVPIAPEGGFAVKNPLKPSLPGQSERKQRGGRKTLKQKKSRKSMRKMSNA
jgi:hypothetical protein